MAPGSKDGSQSTRLDGKGGPEREGRRFLPEGNRHSVFGAARIRTDRTIVRCARAYFRRTVRRMSELWLEAVILGVAVWLLTGSPVAGGVLTLVTIFMGFTAYHAGYGDGALAETTRRAQLARNSTQVDPTSPMGATGQEVS